MTENNLISYTNDIDSYLRFAYLTVLEMFDENVEYQYQANSDYLHTIVNKYIDDDNYVLNFNSEGKLHSEYDSHTCTFIPAIKSINDENYAFSLAYLFNGNIIDIDHPFYIEYVNTLDNYCNFTFRFHSMNRIQNNLPIILQYENDELSEIAFNSFADVYLSENDLCYICENVQFLYLTNYTNDFNLKWYKKIFPYTSLIKECDKEKINDNKISFFIHNRTYIYEYLSESLANLKFSD